MNSKIFEGVQIPKGVSVPPNSYVVDPTTSMMMDLFGPIFHPELNDGYAYLILIELNINSGTNYYCMIIFRRRYVDSMLKLSKTR